MPRTGTLTSSACSPRNYERVLHFNAEQSIVFEDRLPPCTPETPCVEPRVVVRRGSYRVEHPDALGRPFRVVLSIADPKPAKTSAHALPSHLLWWESRGMLTDPDDNCTYTRRP